MVLVKYQISLMCECKAVSFVRGILSGKGNVILVEVQQNSSVCVRKMQNFPFSLGATAITLQYTRKQIIGPALNSKTSCL